jgi:hypothetical protein
MVTKEIEAGKVERPALESVIAEVVLSRLGEPSDLHSGQVKRAFGDKFRVNVYVRAEEGSYRVAHSYFLQADADGNVLTSSPDISRLY